MPHTVFSEHLQALQEAPYRMPLYPENGQSLMQFLKPPETEKTMQPELQTGTYALFQKIQTSEGTVWAYDRQERSAHEIAKWVREQEVMIKLTKNDTDVRVVDYKLVLLED